MSEIYRKFGRAIRRENGFLVRSEEHGQAIEDGRSFASTPIEANVDLPAINESDVPRAVGAIEAMIKPPLVLERVIVSEGVALHEFAGVKWSESTRRVHVSIAKPPLRALIDRADFDIESIRAVAGALARAGPERAAPAHLQLAGNVGAALLPHFIGTIAMQQWAAPHDGKGEWIANVPVARSMPPNWFRPSYQVRPRKAWFHLRADAHGEIDADLPQVVALLSPIHDRTIRALCVARDSVFPVTVELKQFAAVRPTVEWYPYAAGCFGAEMML